jgi:hypothetical protein
MALRYATSFDNVQDSDASGVFSTVAVSGSSAQLNFNATYSRWGTGKGMRYFGSQTGSGAWSVVATRQFDFQSAWYCGAALRLVTAPFGQATPGCEVFSLLDGASYVFELRINTSGLLYVSRNGTVIATDTVVVPNAQFAYVEFGVVIHASTGSYTVRVDGTTRLSGSGVNTSGTGVARANTVRHSLNGDGGSSFATGGEIRWDDMYIADGSGSGVNGLIGDCRPVELLPTANGTLSDWSQTGGTGGSPYTAVNDTPNNGDTSYLSSGTVAQRTTLGYPAAPAGTVKAVILAPWIRKDDANTHTVAARMYRSGTESTSAQTVQPSTAYTVQQIVMETDPQTGSAWSVANVNASEFGLLLVS